MSFYQFQTKASGVRYYVRQFMTTACQDYISFIVFFLCFHLYRIVSRKMQVFKYSGLEVHLCRFPNNCSVMRMFGFAFGGGVLLKIAL